MYSSTGDAPDTRLIDPTQENKFELDDFVTYESIPIQDRKQAELLKSLNIQESAVKDDVYLVKNKTGWMVAQTQPPQDILRSSKGTIRTLKPFIYEGELDQEFNPVDLLDNEEFISKIKDAELKKELNRLRKEKLRIENTTIEDIPFASPLDSVLWNSFRTLDKEVVDVLKKQQYDAIQFKPKQQQTKDLEKEAVSVTEQTVQQEVPSVRTAFESTGATATTLLEEADKAMPGSRELLAGGVREIEAVDVLPPEKPDLIDSTVTTYSFEGRNQPLLASEIQPNKSWFLLDDTMFMEDSTSHVLSNEAYVDFNYKLNEGMRKKFIDENKIGSNTSTKALVEEISNGPFHMVTALIPKMNDPVSEIKEYEEAFSVVYDSLPKGQSGVSYLDKQEGIIYIDPAVMEQQYTEKAWTSSLPEKAIKTREEWENFILRREYAKDKYSKVLDQQKDDYVKKLDRVGLGIPDTYPSKTMSSIPATERSLAVLKSELNLKDPFQNKLYEDFKKQFDASLLVPNRQVPVPLHFLVEVIPGQSSKYLNGEAGRLLTASEMAAFIQGREATHPVEALYHPINNNIRHPNAKAFASMAPSLLDQEQNKQAAQEFLNKVVITEEQPYTISAFEKFETRNQMNIAREIEPDKSEGMAGFRESKDLESYDRKQDQIKRGKGGVRYMRTPEGDILVEYDKDTKRFEPILSNPLDNRSFIYYSPDKDMSAFKPKKRRKARVAAKAPSLKQPKQRSMLAPPVELPRKTELTERVRDTVAYKGASEEARKRIDDQLNELTRRQEQGTL
jgi:hypothetical protein